MSNCFAILNSEAASIAHATSLAPTSQKKISLLPLHSIINDHFDNGKPQITPSGHLGGGETSYLEAAPLSPNKVAPTHPPLNVANIVTTNFIRQNNICCEAPLFKDTKISKKKSLVQNY